MAYDGNKTKQNKQNKTKQNKTKNRQGEEGWGSFHLLNGHKYDMHICISVWRILEDARGWEIESAVTSVSRDEPRRQLGKDVETSRLFFCVAFLKTENTRAQMERRKTVVVVDTKKQTEDSHV